MPDLARAEFRKIAYNAKDHRVRISYQIPNGTEEPDEYQVSVRQPPHPDLTERLEAMRTHVIDLCELDGLEPDQLEVRSVTITWKHGVMGAVITALRELKRSPAPLVLNTPHKAADFYTEEEGDPDSLLPGEAVDAIHELIAEAKLFLEGKRGEEEEEPQKDLFDGDEEEAGELVGAGVGD